MDYKLLDAAGVAELLSITTETVRKLHKRGGFAKPIKVGERLRWREVDVQAWIDQQLTDAEVK